MLVLIASLASFARVNQHGFIETPYRKVVGGGKVADEVEYFMALDERGKRVVEDCILTWMKRVISPMIL